MSHEAHQDGQQADDAVHALHGRLRRMPGILPVRLQDFVHSRQSALREVIGGGTENDTQPATVGWVKQGFAKLLKSALEISGCRFVTERTGYICFGKLFGGLKIQWGAMTANGQYNAFPVAFETTVRKCFFSNASSQTNETAYLFVEAGGFRSDKFGTGVLAFMVTDGATDTSKETDWVAIGF